MACIVAGLFTAGAFDGATDQPATNRASNEADTYRLVDICPIFNIEPYGAFEATAHLPQATPREGDRGRAGEQWCTYEYPEGDVDGETLIITVVVEDTNVLDSEFYQSLDSAMSFDEEVSRIEGSRRQWDGSFVGARPGDQHQGPAISIGARDNNLFVEMLITSSEGHYTSPNELVAVMTRSIDDLAKQMES